MRTLYIETNHGFVLLGDAITFRSGSGYLHARGTMLDSASTSRLLWATSTQEVAPKGTTHEYPIYREPHCTDPSQDSWRVSCVTCG